MSWLCEEPCTAFGFFSTGLGAALLVLDEYEPPPPPIPFMLRAAAEDCARFKSLKLLTRCVSDGRAALPGRPHRQNVWKGDNRPLCLGVG